MEGMTSTTMQEQSVFTHDHPHGAGAVGSQAGMEECTLSSRFVFGSPSCFSFSPAIINFFHSQ